MTFANRERFGPVIWISYKAPVRHASGNRLTALRQLTGLVLVMGLAPAVLAAPSRECPERHGSRTCLGNPGQDAGELSAGNGMGVSLSRSLLQVSKPQKVLETAKALPFIQTAESLQVWGGHQRDVATSLVHGVGSSGGGSIALSFIQSHVQTAEAVTEEFSVVDGGRQGNNTISLDASQALDGIGWEPYIQSTSQVLVTVALLGSLVLSFFLAKSVYRWSQGSVIKVGQVKSLESPLQEIPLPTIAAAKEAIAAREALRPHSALSSSNALTSDTGAANPQVLSSVIAKYSAPHLMRQPAGSTWANVHEKAAVESHNIECAMMSWLSLLEADKAVKKEGAEAECGDDCA